MNKIGRLVYAPNDLSLGVGRIVALDKRTVMVEFPAIDEQREYSQVILAEVLKTYPLEVGQSVTDKNGFEHLILTVQEDLVTGLREIENSNHVRLLESDLTPSLNVFSAVEELAALHITHPEKLYLRWKGLKLRHTFSRKAYAFFWGARVQLMPHQLDIAYEAIQRDPVRLLLADEVGLGKTVEASLILAGLQAEGRGERILIIVPESLGLQWLDELYHKIHMHLVWLDEKRIADARRDFPDQPVFSVYQKIIISRELLLKNPDLLSELHQVYFDVVVVDEAHHLKVEGYRWQQHFHEILSEISRQCRHLLLLTATPMSMNLEQYYACLHLIDPFRFSAAQAPHKLIERREILKQAAKAVFTQDIPTAKTWLAQIFAGDQCDLDLLDNYLNAPEDYQSTIFTAIQQRYALSDVVFRNRREVIGKCPQRMCHLIALKPTAAQELLFQAGEEVCFALAQSTLPDGIEKSPLGILLRSLWASPRALLAILKPYSEELVKALEPYATEVEAQGIAGDARLQWLIRHVEKSQPGEKYLLFVETLACLEDLHRKLMAHTTLKIAIFHEKLSAVDRDLQVAAFRHQPEIQILLSTEMGGEGRNFQFCQNLILYDLPWHPAKVEQRIGRLDRLGQTGDIHIWIPYFSGGYEAAVTKLMHQSVGVFSQTIGGIDYALESIAHRMTELILSCAPAVDWQHLFEETQKQVAQSQQDLDAEKDIILDNSSFSPGRVEPFFRSIPNDLEEQLEQFGLEYAAMHENMHLRDAGQNRFKCENIASLRGSQSKHQGFLGTFRREVALDHVNDTEFLSFGHPFIEHACDWAETYPEGQATLAVLQTNGQPQSGFVYIYFLDIPDTKAHLKTYIDELLYVFAVDEQGQRKPSLEALFVDNHKNKMLRWQKMDPAPLKKHRQHWERLVHNTYQTTWNWALQAHALTINNAKERWQKSYEHHRRHLERGQQERPEDHHILEAAIHALKDKQSEALLDLSGLKPKLVAAWMILVR
jgi:ATP-dependent helicase HepA